MSINSSALKVKNRIKNPPNKVAYSNKEHTYSQLCRDAERSLVEVNFDVFGVKLLDSNFNNDVRLSLIPIVLKLKLD